MKFLNLKKKNKIFLLLYISILVFYSVGSINTFYKFTNIESISSDNDTENDLNTAETFIYTLNGKKYLAEYITREKVEEMKEQIGVRDPNKNYNQIIDGHGTGYAPPTEESLEKLIGKISLLEEIRDPLQPYTYRASKDISGQIYFPTVGDQMYQGSCAAWANVYYAYGYLEAKDYGWDASSGNPDFLLSPAWAYNKVAAFDYGSMPSENGLLIQEWGCATMTTMPYNDADVDSWGDEPAWREAPYHRPLDFTLMSYVGPSTIDTIKSLLDGETPVTFGIDADQFSNGLDDITEDHILSSLEYDDSGSLNHAQCIVGYDDAITEDGDVGAFRVVNSWGDWMDSGYYWFTYDAFNEIGDFPNQEIMFFSDRIDYNPSLVSTWEFDPAPTRMDDIITLGVGPHGAPLDTITPHYDNDENNLFPEFMALDISEFQSYYDLNNDVFFYLELGSSHTPGIISSFLIERYISGVLQEITYESLDVPETTPGYVIGTFMDFDHELRVELEVPEDPIIDDTYIINANVINIGINDESNVEFYLYLDDVLVNSTTISSLLSGETETINYMWTPTEYRTYNFTAYAPPVPDEYSIENNIATKLITLIYLKNYIMATDYEYNWIDASGGTELILSDDGYATIPLPFSFTFYGVAYSTIYLGANGYLSFTDSTPDDFDNDPIPSGDLDNYYLIAPFWDDLLPPAGGHIYYQSFGTYWVAEWLDIYHFGGPTLLGSFEVVLYDTGEIIFNYDYISYTGGGYTCGLNLGVDTDYYNSYQGLNDLTDDLSILFTYESFDHDLSVSLETPVNPQIGNSYIINATVTNTGLNDEYDVDLLLYLDDSIVDSTTISSLPVGANETINYMWIPPDFGLYNFTAYAPPVPDETYTGNNFITEIILIVDSQLFDGMYIDHIFTEVSSYPSRFSYSYYSGSLFYESWDLGGGPATWYVDYQTRVMSGGSIFGDGTHTPAWIFTDVSLGDSVPIAADGEGDHLFSVAGELIYDLPGFGPVDVWVLEDLTLPGGVAWYEKSTGILLDGSFYYSGGSGFYTFDFVDTNVEFTYGVPPGDFILSSNAETPDKDGTFDLTWESAEGALDYSVYQYSSYITEINGSLTLLGDGITDLSLALSGYTDGTYYFIAVAHNAYGDTLSNCIEIVVELGPPGDFILSSNAGTPDKDGTFDLSWTSADRANNYSIYQYSSYITEINGSLTLLGDEITDLSLALSGYTNGTYYFIAVAHNTKGDTLSNCIEIVVELGPPGDFILSSNAGTPDDNGAFDLSWTSADGALTYSVYQYSSYITEINGSLTLLGAGITDLSLALSGYTNGTYYFIAVAYNAYGDTLSNCFEVVVQIPPEPEPEPEPEPPVIPGYNLYFIFVAIGIVSAITIRKRRKKRSEY